MSLLNAEQKRAVECTSGPCLVLAGPGSGKTSVIVEHVKALMRSGVAADRILVLTFTGAAAGEMEQRYRRDAETSAGMPVFGTFHSLCFSVLRAQRGLTRDSVASEDEQRKILRYALRELGESDVSGGYLSDISAIKSDPWRVREDEEDELHIRRIYDAYCELMGRAGKIDFDDMITDTLSLFCEGCGSWREALDRPGAVLRKWQAKFDHILLDEAQDLNALQLYIAYLLGGFQANVFMVGDDDQSIYGFRGVRPGNLVEFTQVYPQAQVIRLSVNYRSLPEVSETALKLISNNTNRFKKSVLSFRRPEPGSGTAVSYRFYSDEQDEADGVCSQVRAWAAKGVPFDEMAVLCRTSVQMRPFIRAFCDAGVPFVCDEAGAAGLTEWVSEDLDAYMGLASDIRNGWWSRRRLVRIMNKPRRGLVAWGLLEDRVDPKAWAENMAWDEDAAEQVEFLWTATRALGRMKPEAALEYIWRGCGYGTYVEEVCAQKNISVSMAREQAEGWLRKFEVRGGTTPAGNEKKSCGPRSGVRIMTMHASKGLEFAYVFIPTLCEGVIPHARSRTDAEMEEERRLMYVALTRAADRVMLSHTGVLHGHEMMPSRFLKEMGIRTCQKTESD